ncbi:hypothetical protein GWI33_010172 [Rhynchophorus ferrugineus]|uniref:Uncharacterized protein n=1 Tax=Rhynchophorus ferrugineus TaxID=354439 RepID=A0A834IR73_RHYFE|nr:hypothetical protein GWI33_010172 [Rhynchophorus ferrugineus]
MCVREISNNYGIASQNELTIKSTHSLMANAHAIRKHHPLDPLAPALTNQIRIDTAKWIYVANLSASRSSSRNICVVRRLKNDPLTRQAQGRNLPAGNGGQVESERSLP